MSSQATLQKDWPTGFAAACDRLVHPAIDDANERGRHRRLVGVLLAGPFLAAAALAQSLGPLWGGVSAPIVAAAVLGVGWLAAYAAISTARRRLVEPAALALAAILSSIAIATAGGLSSPLTMLAVALPLEAAWVGGSRRAALAGAVAAVAATVLAVGLIATDAVTTVPITGASAWHWLVPLAYLATLWPRLSGAWIPRAGHGHATSERPLEAVMDAVVLRMSMTGEVCRASHQAEKLLGLAPDMLLGAAFFERIHVADRVGYLNALADLREGASSRVASLRLRLPASEGATADTRFGQFAAELARDEAADNVIAIIRDDGRTAELSAELAAATDRADSTEVAKNRFLAAVSHELRTPLNAILGFSHILENETPGAFHDAARRDYARLIGEAGDHLLAVVNAILDVSKIESGAYAIRPELFRFDEAVKLSVAMTAREAEAKNVSVTRRLADDIGEIRCDRRAMQQVLINLLSNAVKFTPAGGAVTISARRGPSGLAFEVSDTGIGIAEEDLARIGTPFTQVQNDYTRQYEGTGLGLALVKGLVDLQNGTMAIASTPGAGTTVSIALPMAEANHGEAPIEDDRGSADGATASEWIDDTTRKTA